MSIGSFRVLPQPVNLIATSAGFLRVWAAAETHSNEIRPSNENHCPHLTSRQRTSILLSMTSTHVVPKSTQSTSRESLFQPSVTVCDDGTIHVDWFDCYVSTQSIGESGLIDDVAYEEPPGHPHSALLDSIIMRGKSDADALRALADYIDAQS